MSFVGLLKAASTSSKLIKGAKGVFTIIEITDTVMDTALLGDEIARAIMGENYDPALRDLSREVVDAGKKYDEKMTQVAKANSDITNLSGGINSLKDISLDYGDRQELVFKQLQKLDDLKKLLIKTAPTTYNWFQTIGAKAVINSDAQKKLDAIKAQLGPNYISIALYSAGLGFRAITFGYEQYKKRKQSNEDIPERKRRNAQSDIFEGIDPKDVQDLRKANIAANKTLKIRAITTAKVMYKGVTKLMTIGSFGMNIYTIVTKVQSRDKAMADLREIHDRYTRETPIYEYALNGSPDDAALKSLAEFFTIDISSDDTKSALKKGYNGILIEYDNTLNDLLSGPDDKGVREGGIDGAYTAMIQKFEETVVDGGDVSVLTSLKNSYTNFKNCKQIALDKTKPSEDRKNQGLDKIRDEFINSVSQQLNKILETLTVQIDDHNSLNTLIVSARKLNQQEAKIDEAIEEDIKNLEQIFGKLTEEQKQARRKTEKAKKIQELESAIKDGAKSALNILDISNLNRNKFKTVEAIEEAIRKLMEELNGKNRTEALGFA